jgi:hypothetical protein
MKAEFDYQIGLRHYTIEVQQYVHGHCAVFTASRGVFHAVLRLRPNTDAHFATASAESVSSHVWCTASIITTSKCYATGVEGHSCMLLSLCTVQLVAEPLFVSQVRRQAAGGREEAAAHEAGGRGEATTRRGDEGPVPHSPVLRAVRRLHLACGVALRSRVSIRVVFRCCVRASACVAVHATSSCGAVVCRVVIWLCCTGPSLANACCLLFEWCYREIAKARALIVYLVGVDPEYNVHFYRNTVSGSISVRTAPHSASPRLTQSLRVPRAHVAVCLLLPRVAGGLTTLSTCTHLCVPLCCAVAVVGICRAAGAHEHQAQGATTGCHPGGEDTRAFLRLGALQRTHHGFVHAPFTATVPNCCPPLSPLALLPSAS